MTTPNPVTFAALGMIGLIPTLAGCATAAEPPVPGPVAESAVMDAPMTGAEAPAASAGSAGDAYVDGTYQAQGGYQSPGGPEIIELTLTIANNSITDIVVTPRSESGTSQRYQSQFASGVAAETVGKPVNEISVTRISGSSLTSGGFTEALNAIKADAKA